MLAKLDDVIFFNDHADLDNTYSDVVTFNSIEMGHNATDFKNINFDNDNFDEDDPETIVHVGLMTWCNRYINNARNI